MSGDTCPVCGDGTYTSFFELQDVPTQDGVLWNTKQEALNAPTGSIQLAFCRSCGYVGNKAHQPEKIRYDPDYSFSLHFSPTYRRFVADVADRLVGRFHVGGQLVLEIGCGQGDFLRQICQAGCCDGVGIDPSVNPHVERLGSSHLAFIQGVYADVHASIDASLVCCRQVLDQIPDPRSFVELVRRNIGSRAGTAVYFEVPNAQAIFESMLIRNVIYEKCSWFTAHSLTRLFELCGFEVIAAEPCFEGDQYLGIEATPASKPTTGRGDATALETFERSIAAFRDNYLTEVRRWRAQMQTIRESGKRAVCWGAGAGAISFLSTLRITDDIPFVVDINPNRQGRFLPLTGQQVVSPEVLVQYRPDVTIVTNATYTREIQQQVRDLGVQCEFMVV